MKKLITVLLAMTMLISTVGFASAENTSSDVSSWPVVSVDVLSFTDSLSRKDEVQDALNEYLVSIDAGVQVEFIVGTWGDRANTLTMLLADGDNPIDLFCWRFYSTVESLVQNDQIISLESYKETYPELFSMYPEAAYLTCQIDGIQYSLPIADSFGGFTTYMLRRSVAEALGIEDLDGTEITLDELNEILLQAEELFPDQAWWADLAPVQVMGIDTLGDDYWLGVLMNNGIDQTEIVNYYATDEFREWCELTKWYNDNGMVADDPEISAATGTQYADGIISGQYVSGYSIDYIRALMQGQGATGDGDFILLKLTDFVGSNSWVNNGWCISSLSKNPDAAMKVLYLMTTDENVCRFFTLGIEGVTYQVNEDGTASMADGVDDSTLGWNLSCCWFYPNQCLSIPYNTTMTTYFTDMMACWTDEDAQYSSGMGFNFDSSSVYDQVKACQMIVDQYRDALLYGQVDVDTYLTKLNEELEAAGINDIIEEKNRQYQEFLAANA